MEQRFKNSLGLKISSDYAYWYLNLKSIFFLSFFFKYLNKEAPQMKHWRRYYVCVIPGYIWHVAEMFPSRDIGAMLLFRWELNKALLISDFSLLLRFFLNSYPNYSHQSHWCHVFFFLNHITFWEQWRHKWTHEKNLVDGKSRPHFWRLCHKRLRRFLRKLLLMPLANTILISCIGKPCYRESKNKKYFNFFLTQNFFFNYQ